MGACVRCGKQNEYQVSDYRCHECFGEGSPHVAWTDRETASVGDSSSPVTWPPWWTLSRLSEGKGYCSVHRDYFPSRGCCVSCVADGRV